MENNLNVVYFSLYLSSLPEETRMLQSIPEAGKDNAFKRGGSGELLTDTLSIVVMNE